MSRNSVLTRGCLVVAVLSLVALVAYMRYVSRRASERVEGIGAYDEVVAHLRGSAAEKMFPSSLNGLDAKGVCYVRVLYTEVVAVRVGRAASGGAADRLIERARELRSTRSLSDRRNDAARAREIPGYFANWSSDSRDPVAEQAVEDVIVATSDPAPGDSPEDFSRSSGVVVFRDEVLIWAFQDRR